MAPPPPPPLPGAMEVCVPKMRLSMCPPEGKKMLFGVKSLPAVHHCPLSMDHITSHNKINGHNQHTIATKHSQMVITRG
ncbi:hypothetical protein niasHT_010844 [Heterodera trifolii]|uniref:Uncharacterized protein n=1 Tax=Heterodera trifolii TaxID=157864 RepID=A0ABD2LDB6_9BILA